MLANVSDYIRSMDGQKGENIYLPNELFEG